MISVFMPIASKLLLIIVAAFTLSLLFLFTIILNITSFNKALDKKDYDLALIRCELPAVSDATYIIKQLGYDDKQLDKYLNALQNANSEDEIKSTYKTLQKYVKEKAIFIVLLLIGIPNLLLKLLILLL